MERLEAEHIIALHFIHTHADGQSQSARVTEVHARLREFATGSQYFDDLETPQPPLVGSPERKGRPDRSLVYLSTEGARRLGETLPGALDRIAWRISDAKRRKEPGYEIRRLQSLQAGLVPIIEQFLGERPEIPSSGNDDEPTPNPQVPPAGPARGSGKAAQTQA